MKEKNTQSEINKSSSEQPIMMENQIITEDLEKATVRINVKNTETVIDKSSNSAEKSEQRMECNLCGKTYIAMLNLRNHLNSAHQLKLERGQCHICKHMCGRQLTQHLLSTHNMTEVLSNFECCDLCGISVEKRNIPRHKKIVHEKEQRQDCDICKKTLSSKGTLKKHVQQVLCIFSTFV